MEGISRWIAAIAAATALAAGVGSGANASDGAKPPGLEFLGQAIVPTGTTFAGTTVGGLSSITYDAGARRLLQPLGRPEPVQPARFYTLRLDLVRRPARQRRRRSSTA